MANERIQFQLARRDANIFEELAGVEHADWPRNISDKSGWCRAAIRVLHARYTGDSKEWFADKNGKLKPLGVKELEGVAAEKIDITLSREDHQRVHELIRAKIGKSPPAVVRAALSFLRMTGAELQRGAALLQGSGYETSPLKIADIVDREALEPAVPRFRMRLQPGGTRALSQTARKRRASLKLEEDSALPDLDQLFAIIEFTHSFNSWLVIQIAKQSVDEATTPENYELHERKLEEDHDLEKLLKDFDEEKLAPPLRGKSIFPEHWQFALADADRRAIGRRVLESFIKDRSQRLRPLGDTGADYSDAQVAAARRAWRHWSRSHASGEDERECDAPFEFIAVVHHWLATRSHGDPAMAAHDLQRLLVDGFDIRNRAHTQALANACDAFNLDFYGSTTVPPSALTRGVDERRSCKAFYGMLADTWIESQAPDGTDGNVATRSSRWAFFLYLVFCVARFVRPVYSWRTDFQKEPQQDQKEPSGPQPQLLIRSMSSADFMELRARVFGAQTAIDGLHWLLRGGIIPRAGWGRNWLITGPPGSGKSTLGLHLTVDMARRRRIGVIVCSEERALVIQERLMMFGLSDPARYDLLTRDEFDQKLEKLASGEINFVELRDSEPVKGMLVVVSATGSKKDLDLGAWLKHVHEKTRTLDQALRISEEKNPSHRHYLRSLRTLWQWKAIVVDSLDALEVEAPDFGGPRRTMVELMQIIEATLFWGILLCGERNRYKEHLTYLSDTVIELGSSGNGVHRTLQVHKCRTQPYDPGTHLLQLAEGAGVTIHPNLASTQRWVRRRVRPPLDSGRIVRIPDEILWPRFDGSEHADSDPPVSSTHNWKKGDPPVAGIWRSSSVLLYGPSQSGKTPFILNLMAQRMTLADNPHRPLGSNGSVLILSFRGNEQDYLRPLDPDTRLGKKWLKNVSDLQLLWFGPDETMSSAQFTHELVRRIQWARRDSLPFDWIVFSGIEALESKLPEVARDPSFWPTILAIAASEEITTAFVVNDTLEANNFVARHDQDMDYVLQFERKDGFQRVLTRKSPNTHFSVEFPWQGGPIRPFDPENRDAS